MDNKKCLICGNSFPPKSNKKYCSDLCRAKAKKDNRNAWLKKSGYQKENRAKKRAIQTKDYEKLLEHYYPVDKEYWTAFKNNELRLSEEANKESKMRVNGISIYDENFEEKVLKSIEEEERILCSCIAF